MAKTKSSDREERLNYGVNLLISLLLRYPEIGTVRFEPDGRVLSFNFMFSGVIDSQKYLVVKDKITNSLSAYHRLNGTSYETIDVIVAYHDVCSTITLIRDVATLSKGEITIAVALLTETFQDSLIDDDPEIRMVPDDDVAFQEDFIENMLDNVRLHPVAKLYKGLFAFREDGRVLVFNR